jgi:hypothetical protein
MRGRERDVVAGEPVVVPAGTPHVWGNPNEDDVHLILEFRPALRMEEWFETFLGLQKDGKVNPNSGLPNSLQWAVISREYEDEIYLASPPLWVQRVRFGLLAPIGKLLGYKAHYPKYSAAEIARGEGAGPPSTTMVMARAVAMAASVGVVSIFFLLGRMRWLRKGQPQFQLPSPYTSELLRTLLRRTS